MWLFCCALLDITTSTTSSKRWWQNLPQWNKQWVKPIRMFENGWSRWNYKKKCIDKGCVLPGTHFMWISICIKLKYGSVEVSFSNLVFNNSRYGLVFFNVPSYDVVIFDCKLSIVLRPFSCCGLIAPYNITFRPCTVNVATVKIGRQGQLKHIFLLKKSSL